MAEEKKDGKWVRIVQMVVMLPLVGWLWFVGMLVIRLTSLYPGWDSLFWTVGMIALLLSIAGLIFSRRRFARWSAAVLGACVAFIVGMEAYRYFTVTRYPRVSDEIYWYAYFPFRENTRAVKVEADPALRLTGAPPLVSAAYALYPLSAGVARALYPPIEYDWTVLTADGSDSIYEKLLDGEVDLIFGLSPSEAQLREAEKRGVAYEITPFAREAFVFFVNRRNPAAGLTSEQVRGIYSGKIRLWKEVGAGSGPIRAFQRNEGSGSQTMLERIMGGTPLMKPIRENRVGDMGGIINRVADYRNYPDALGFSFRFFAEEMFRNDEIKLLALDGVEPTRENIRSGRYPFIADCCIITVKPRDENIRRIVDFLRSPAGCEMIEKTGYTPLFTPGD